MMYEYVIGRLVIAAAAAVLAALLIGAAGLAKSLSAWAGKPKISGDHALSAAK